MESCQNVVRVILDTWRRSLNPCYNGILLEREAYAPKIWKSKRLNPCYNGILLEHINKTVKLSKLWQVLILVIMESCQNCKSEKGCYGHFLVLILVIMESCQNNEFDNDDNIIVVLILVIMESCQNPLVSNEYSHRFVLILVIMESCQSTKSPPLIYISGVLILVIMESCQNPKVWKSKRIIWGS